jgi:hypothetical protein
MKRESGGHYQPREARLRPAAAHLYPGVPCAIWMQDATMSDIVLSQRLRCGEASLGSRALDPEHFEFRPAGGKRSGRTLRRGITDRSRADG